LVAIKMVENGGMGIRLKKLGYKKYILKWFDCPITYRK
jgi:hypothetical protein